MFYVDFDIYVSMLRVTIFMKLFWWNRDRTNIMDADVLVLQHQDISSHSTEQDTAKCPAISGR